jgi:hypothetical protein
MTDKGRAGWLVGVFPAFVAALVGCGGTVYSSDPGGGDAEADAPVDAPGWDAADAADAAKPDADASSIDAFDEYVDPGCPDAPPPSTAFVCDPLAPPPGDCAEGEACYPYVQYPSAPCEAEVYGSYCRVAGIQTQGEICGSGDDCAAGFVCVVSGSGTQCVRLCSLTDPSSCPNGQICGPIDVVGMGGCL